MDTLASTSGRLESTMQRVIEAVGCRFTEYRGEGRPIVGQPPARPGDVYFDVKEQPYTAWVCQSDYGWNQWVSMAESRKSKHPEQERVLYPSVQRLAWVPLSGYDGYLRQTILQLGKRKDIADTHIKIILDQERGSRPALPPINEPSPDRAPSPDDISDADTEQLVQQAVMEYDTVDNSRGKSEEAMMAESQSVFGNRCRVMREKVQDIQKEVAISSGMWYMYYSVLLMIV